MTLRGAVPPINAMLIMCDRAESAYTIHAADVIIFAATVRQPWPVPVPAIPALNTI